MANLSVADRTRVWRAVMRKVSREPGVYDWGTLSKDDLYDPSLDSGAVADADAWIDTHQGTTTPDNVGYVGALDTTFAAQTDSGVKALVFLAVVCMRQGTDFIRSIFGEID